MSETRPVAWWREPTRAQWMTFIAAWMGWVLDAFDFVIFSIVAADIAKEFGVGPTALAGSITLTLVVRLAGGFVAGWMADRWGRKLPLMISLLWFAVFDAAIYFAPSFAWILVFRTLFGFGMGAEWTAGTAMAMESFPERSRKIASGLLQAGWPVGFFAAALVAHFVVPAFGWRAMFIVAAFPALLVVPIRFLVPDEASKAKVAAGGAAPQISMRDLLAPAVVKKLFVGIGVVGLGFAAYYGMTIHYSMMMRSELGMTATSGFNMLMIFNVGMGVGVLCAGTVATRYGIVTALAAPALLMCLAMPLYVGMVPSLLPLGAFLGGLLGAGYSGVTPVLTTSLFPEHVRARAIGIVYHGGALLAAFVPTIIGLIAGHTKNLGQTIGIVSAISLASMACAVFIARRMLVITSDAEHAAAAAGVVTTVGDEALLPQARIIAA